MHGSMNVKFIKINAQIPWARAVGRLKLEWWLPILVGPQQETCSVPNFWILEF